MVERDHAQNNVNQTYISQNGQTGDAGDQYVGLDRVGRVADQNWYSTTTHSSVDDFQYSYNQDGEVVSRNNTLDAAMNETYSYDNLGQLSSFARGSHTQTWTPDALGNFSSITTDGSTQTRTANQQNQYTSISGSGTITYDANGNITADGSGNTFVYDAWNRLVSVKSGGTTVASYVYDGLNRQVQITENGVLTDLYYSAQGQSVEEYINGAVSAIDVWSPVYVNALVYRQQNGTRYYASQDANWNITAWVDTSGNVQERYAYDPYGAITVLSANWQVQSGSNLRLPYGFQGMRTDWYVGNLNFSRYGRVESPSLMRWLQTDPIGLNAGNNDYEADGDDPIDYTDPTGESYVRRSGWLHMPHLVGSGNLGKSGKTLEDWLTHGTGRGEAENTIRLGKRDLDSFEQEVKNTAEAIQRDITGYQSKIRTNSAVLENGNLPEAQREELRAELKQAQKDLEEAQVDLCKTQEWFKKIYEKRKKYYEFAKRVNEVLKKPAPARPPEPPPPPTVMDMSAVDKVTAQMKLRLIEKGWERSKEVALIELQTIIETLKITDPLAAMWLEAAIKTARRKK